MDTASSLSRSCTGLCLIPLAPNATSPTAKLLTHLSHRYPTQEHHTYSLEHRLFSDTSSQLPGSDVKQRAFTHILTISHNPTSSFVCATKAGNPEQASLITIPTNSSDSFNALILTKFQPLWHVRQAVAVENGVSVLLRNNEWRVCIGDVKVAARSTGAGTLRGMIIELSQALTAENNTDQTTEEEDQVMFQGVLQEIFKGSGQSLDAIKMTVRRTSSNLVSENGYLSESSPDWELAKLYMDVLRGQGVKQ